MFSISHFAKGSLGLAALACSACFGPNLKPDAIEAPQVFYTVTGEIALARREPRIAALQYTAVASLEIDPTLLKRATEVTAESLQPSLTAVVAARWISLDPNSLEAHRAAAKAALMLHKIAQSADQYRVVLATSPRGADAEFTELETELGAIDDVFGARQLADRLAASFPASAAALRLQGFAALRADDPAAAVRSFSAALAIIGSTGAAESTGAAQAAGIGRDARRELMQGLWRARILTGDSEEPLALSQALAEREATPANQLDFALLLLAAQRNAAAVAQLESLLRQPESAPVALRLLGLVEFQEGNLEAAGRRFTDLLTTGKFIDDSFYYLGLIAERRGDLERALRLYAQVQNGDNAVAALLRACSILQAHGAAPAAQQLLDHLIEDEPGRAPEIMAARARIFADAGDAQQAIEVLDRGLLQYPDSVDIRYAIASTYEDQGRFAAALHELKEVLKSRPDDPAAMNAYGYTLADHHQELAHARTLIERAYATAPKNAAILDSLGWVLFRQGHDEQALPYLSAAYADDRGGDIAAHLGEVMWQLGRRADAEHVWSEAAAVDSGNHLLNATRQRLHASK
ncbi:MAG TPA: tetratricopeptide repeat protein [Steroidobacteraceae bacterium]|nr:tetratricopeptide repeat protein [Steroidobacteraceae bacterium]